MGRIVFVTVGTSAITNHELWDPKKSGDLPASLPMEGNWGEIIRADEAAIVRTYEMRHKHVKWKEVEKQVLATRPDLEKDITDIHRKFWDRTSDHHKRENRRMTSAETISTWLAGKADGIGVGPLRAAEDQVVLLASRTCVGQMAGRINETIFREFLFTGEGEKSVVTRTVDDLQLEGILDQGNNPDSLSGQVRTIFREHAECNPRTPLFNITGGFKGVIPSIAVICAEAETNMIYLHEGMKNVVLLSFENGGWTERYAAIHVEA